MSVQAGIWNFDGKPVDRKLLGDLRETLKQQGPDGEFSYIEGNFAMLYRPFHTTAESRWEKQPYFSRRNFVITWDGRLDNRDELIGELDDLTKQSTDVAIVAAAFDRYGTGCFRRLVGDWAVSVWKPEQRELIFAVDYMCIRHIFYYPKNDRVWWSTDLTPLVLLSGDNFHIDDDYIAGYFAHDPDGRLTPYREICEVPPGQFVRILEGGNTAVDRYWWFNPKSRIRYSTDREYEEHFRYVLRQSVRRRLRSDSPILAELSGGLDSSSIVCMADDILAKEGHETTRLDTLSYYNKAEPNGDDWIYIPKLEEYRRRTGHHIDAGDLGSSSISLEYPSFVPLPGYSGVTRRLEIERATIVRNGTYRVVLSGIGGDEFTGGVPNPVPQLADLIVQCKFVKLAQELFAWSLVKRCPWIQLLVQAATSLFPPSLGQHFMKQAKVETWIENHFAKRTKLAIRLLDVDEHFSLWLPSRRSLIGGVMLMASKLSKRRPPLLVMEEVRYPYLDQDFIEFTLSIPPGQLLRPGERRSLMRRALVGTVPQQILARKTKQLGALTPVTALRRNWEKLETAFDSPLSSSLGYINRDRFLKTLRAARDGERTHLVHMLRAISLEFWLRALASRGLIQHTTITPMPLKNSTSQDVGMTGQPDSITPAGNVVGAF